MGDLKCMHFGICNACVNYEGGYAAQLEKTSGFERGFQRALAG